MVTCSSVISTSGHSGGQFGSGHGGHSLILSGILPRPQRRPNGYRVYGEDALTYLRLVRQTQALGITLADTRELIHLMEQHKRPCERVHALVAQRLRDVDAMLRELTSLRETLRATLKTTSPGKCKRT